MSFNQSNHQVNKRVVWSEMEIKDMLSIFKEKNILSALDGKRFRNKQIMEAVETEMCAKGYKKTSAQIRTKWKALKHEYKDKESNNLKSGRGRKDCEWNNDLDDLLKTRPAIKPLSYGVDTTCSTIPTDEDNNVEEDFGEVEDTSELNEENIDDFISTISPKRMDSPLNTSYGQEEITNITNSRTTKSFAKATNLAKTLEVFTNNWESAQVKINREFLKNQKEIIDLEFKKQRSWEEEIIKQEREIAKEERKENQELFKSLIVALGKTSK